MFRNNRRDNRRDNNEDRFDEGYWEAQEFGYVDERGYRNCRSPQHSCCIGPRGPRGVQGPPGRPGPFLSCYLEAAGDKQTVGSNGYIAFDTNPDNDAIDIVGEGIAVNAEGTVFTINRPGLYHVEWSIDLSSFTSPAIVGITENGQGISAITAYAAGNVSSGALIHVETTPYRISLVNFAEEIHLQNPAPTIDASASIRILRFADGPVLS